MTTWTLTTSSSGTHRTTIGPADNPDHARRLLITAARAAIAQATGDSRPRYTLHIDGHIAAIIQTGDDDLGLPDHAGAAELLAQLDRARNPFRH
jgi:hypothetical protein